jgi:ubiquitin carboxyl-terminal hydrolase 9/24
MTVSKGGSNAGSSGTSSGSSSQSVGHDAQNQPADPLIGSSVTHVTPLSPVTGVMEQETGKEVSESGSEPVFPVAELSRLDDMINRPRWVIPVLPRGELELLLDAAIALSRKGLDQNCEPCQRFYRDGLTTSFTKILTDEAVTGWKLEIHVSHFFEVHGPVLIVVSILIVPHLSMHL